MRRSQTATEYLIILAVVIVIAIIVIGVLGGIPGIGGGSSNRARQAELISREVGVENYKINGTYGLLLLKNNKDSTISITNISIDDSVCFSSNLPASLKMGERKKVSCIGTFTDYTSRNDVPDIEYIYRDLVSQATYGSGGYVPTVTTYTYDDDTDDSELTGNGFDEDWDTYEEFNEKTPYYSIPSGLSSALLEIKALNNYVEDDSELSGRCKNQSSGSFITLFSYIDTSSLYQNNYTLPADCISGNQLELSLTCQGGGPDWCYFYEEKVWWTLEG
jgi:hypothetical protein